MKRNSGHNGGRYQPFPSHVADSLLDLDSYLQEASEAIGMLRLRVVCLRQDAEAHSQAIQGACATQCRRYQRTDPSRGQLLQIVRGSKEAA